MPSRRVSPIYLYTLTSLLGVFVARAVAQVSGRYDFFEPMIGVRELLDRAYVEEPDWEKLQTSAIEGMLEALDDPYAQYIPASKQPEFEKAMTGEFVGIGAEVQMLEGPTMVDGNPVEGGYLQIISPLEGSPAWKAGIMAGDLITHIDGESTLPLSVDDCIDKLTGKPGDKVTVTVQRGEEVVGQVTVTRERITLHAVRGIMRDGADGKFRYMMDEARHIAYIRMTQFTPAAGNELVEAIKEISAIGPIGGLVLDLRNNPGGILDAATQVADLFLSDGVIVSVRGRSDDDAEYKAHSAGTQPDYPIIVLVNGASASASEIVSGSLQDHDRAVVLGSRTFGKGLVQSVMTVPHSGGAQVKFTAQRYYLPSGRLIQREDESETWGVDPSPGFYVPLTDEEELARQLKRRDLDVLRGSSNGANGGNEAGEAKVAFDLADPNVIESDFADRQLALALKAMQQRVDGGEWVAVSDEVGQHAAIAARELDRLVDARERMLLQFSRIEKRIEAISLAEATGAANEQPEDLWPDDVDVSDGHLEVYDKSGKAVARLKITGRDVERWLLSADVELESGGDANPGDGGGASKDETDSGDEKDQD